MNPTPYRADADTEPPNEKEIRQRKESLANVFDDLSASHLHLVRTFQPLARTFRRGILLSMACVTLTTAASLITAVNLHNSRNDTHDLIAAIAAACPPAKDAKR